MINRREFILLAGMATAVAFLKGQNQMQFSELIMKIGRGEQLNELELSQLRDETRAVEEVKNFAKGWVTAGTNTPIFLPPIETIYSQKLSVDTASLTVSIPTKYRHLFVMGAGRVTGAGASSQYILGRFNGDDGANYSQQKLQAAGASVTGAFAGAQTGVLIGMASEGGTSAEKASGFFAVVPHYLNNYNKNTILLTSRASLITLDTSEWANTAAIETLTFVPVTDEFAAGFVFSVYGIV
jgi:hypothetical protein